MTSLLSDNTNPFLKNYSNTSLLKRNYQVLKQANQIKSNPYQNQTKSLSKYNVSHLSVISNPFQQKTLNSVLITQQRENFFPKHQSKLNDSEFNNSRVMFQSLDRNVLYKGLENVGLQELWKHSSEKQARYQLRNYGPEALRYQYSGMNNRQKNQPNLLTKQFQNSKRNNFHEKIATDYYGYETYKSDRQDFPLQKLSKDRQAKPKNQYKMQPHNSKKLNYIQNIPEDRNQDFGTTKLIKTQKISFDLSKQDNIRESDPGKLSIENFYANQSSVLGSEGFGQSSEMYESSDNFKNKFRFSRVGPLNTHNLQDSKIEESVQSNSSIKKVQYSQTIQFRGRIYQRIQL